MSKLRPTKWFLCSVLLLWLIGCDTEIEPGAPDEADRQIDGLVVYHEQRLVVSLDAAAELDFIHDVGHFGEKVWKACQEQLSNPRVDDTALGLSGRSEFQNCPEIDASTMLPQAPATCEQAICSAAVSQCVAETMIGLTSIVADEEMLFISSDGNTRTTLSVPPQKPRAKARLAEAASRWMSYSISVAGANLESAFGSISPSEDAAVCTAAVLTSNSNSLPVPLSDGERQKWSELLVAIVAEGAHFQIETAEKVAELFSSVAELESAETSNESIAARFAWTEGLVNRSRAVQVLLGGDRQGGLHGFSEGIGAHSHLSNSETRALELLRFTGLHPAHLATEPSAIANVVATKLNEVAELSQSTEEMLSRNSVQERDFARSSRHLAELVALSGIDESLMLPDGRHAATAAPSLSAPPARLRLSARRGTDALLEDHPRSFFVGLPPSHLNEPSTGIADSIAYAGMVLSEVMSTLQASGHSAELQLASRAIDSVAAMTTGRYAGCGSLPGFPPVPGSIHFATPVDGEYIAVTGADQLRCATDGNVGGAECELQTLTSLPAHLFSSSQNQHVYAWQWTGGTRESYILRRNNGSERYSVVDAVYVPPVFNRCTFGQVVPELNLLADRVMTLKGGAPVEQCVGIDVDQRIPLENELADTSLPYEASWSHYLDVAERAAARSDMLAREIVDGGIEIERRVEVATRELESVCGGNIDVASLVEPLLPAPPTTCLDAEGTALGDGYVCRGGVAVSDPVSTILARAGSGDPDAIELASCVGIADTVPWVSLGNEKLCLWHDSRGNPCVGASQANLACPVVRTTECSTQMASAIQDAESALEFELGHPVELTAAVVATNLGIFDESPPDLPGEEPPRRATPPCGELRTLRASSSAAARQEAFDAIVASEWLRHPSAEEIADRVAWQARPYDYGMLTLDDESWTGTGDPLLGDFDASTWPCGAAMNELAECSGVEGAGTALAANLGCAWTAHCAESGQSGNGPLLDRVRMNQRLGRAAITLRAISGTGLRDMLVPYHRYEVDGDDVDYIIMNRVSPQGLSVPGLYSHIDGTLVGEATTIPGVVAQSLTYRDTTLRVDKSIVFGEAYCANVTGCGAGNETCSNASQDYCKPGVSGVYGCMHNNVGFLWSWLSERAYHGLVDCELDNSASANDCGRIFSPCRSGRVGTDSGHNSWRGPFLARDLSREFGMFDNTAHQIAILHAAAEYWPAHADDSESVVVAALEAALYRNGLYNDSGVAFRDVFPRPDESDPENPVYPNNSAEPTRLDLMSSVSNRDILDALELLCAATEEVRGIDNAGVAGTSPTSCDIGDGIDSSTVRDSYHTLYCMADAVLENAGRVVFSDIPESAVRRLQGSLGNGDGVVGEGEVGAIARSTVAEIVQVRESNIRIAGAIRGMAFAAKTLQSQLRQLGISAEQVELGLSSAQLQAMNTCLGAIGAPGGGLICRNAATEYGLAIIGSELQAESLGLQEASLYEQFEREFSSHSEVLSATETAIDAAVERIRASTARLEGKRNEARRLVGQAAMFSDEIFGKHMRVNTALRRRYSTAQVRYENASVYARRMAFIAKLAVEQRLGVRLSDMTADLTLVESPASWQSSVCVMNGADFAEIRQDEAPTTVFESYEGAFVGDYVQRLRAVVESYRIDYPFHEGDDRAVVSLRDDILKVRNVCSSSSVRSANLVLGSDALMGEPWGTLDTCDFQNAGDPDISEVCVNVTRGVSLGDVGRHDGVTGHRIRFGESFSIPGFVNRATPESVWGQVLGDVEPGYYVMSWYARDVDPAIAPEDIVRVSRNGEELDVRRGVMSGCVSGEWCRYYMDFEIRRGGDYQVAIQPVGATADASTGYLDRGYLVDIGGLQLTRRRHPRPSSVDDVDLLDFVDTDERGASRLEVCEDTYGERFREGWRYECTRVCPAGVGTDCRDEVATRECYYEREFDLSAEQLAAGSALLGTGFAAGNFNYRFDGVGVNFVGSQIVDCSESQLPSGCYNNGTVLYSLKHSGPYSIVDYDGELFDVRLFEGNIEHSRGLASERVLGIPASSADLAYMQPFVRREFQGRPLDGQFVLRVWDREGLDMNRLEDVQFVLDYRYWTRFD